MAMISRSCSAILVLLTACGGSAPSTKTDGTSASSGAALAIVELKFFVGDKMGMRLHTDGRLETIVSEGSGESWQDVATLSPDGTVTGKDGKTGRLQPDGTFAGSNGEVAHFKLDGDALVVGDQRITIRDDGTVAGAPEKLAKLRIEGATATQSRRTALLILGLLLS